MPKIILLASWIIYTILNFFYVLLNKKNLFEGQTIDNKGFCYKVADRIVFLEEGQVTFNGSSQAFFESDNPRIQLYLQQLL